MATDNDVVVFFKGNYYLVTEAQWKTPQNELAAAAVNDKSKAAIDSGAIVAFIPQAHAGPGVGAYSTVINLPKITGK